MKKYAKLTLITILLILIIAHLTYSYGTDEKKKKEFFEVKSTEVSITENIEMTINIENIQYDNFTLKISSDTNIKQMELEEDEEIDVTKGNNEISMQFNKKESNLNKIILYFTLPDTIKGGEKITLTANVQNNENDEENQTITREITVIEEKKTENTENNTDNTQPSKNETEKNDQKTDSENKNADETNNQQQIENQMQKDNENSQQQNNNQQSDNTGKLQSQTTAVNQNNQKQTTQNASVESTNTVTYNGLDNNYLSELSVDGYTLNAEFSKENQTYFVTIDSNVENLEITAKVENSNSKLTIYGNESFQEGTNKILITVTAENGDVRNYRIYVTKN
ncbi:MAG: cadherin-like beta sandwich domain-containing protein [Clostridia bacterium]